MSKNTSMPVIEMWPIEKLVPYEKNAKVHDQAQIARIVESIKKTGWDQPIVVEADGTIIKGHGRRLAGLALSLKEVPVIVRRDLDKAGARAARLADNRAAIGDVDPDILRAELADLDFDLGGIFDAKELEFFTADLGEINPDAFVTDVSALAAVAEAETKREVADIVAKPVPVALALGFKNIPGDKQRVVAQLMAQLEADFNLPPDQAFVAFVEGVIDAKK